MIIIIIIIIKPRYFVIVFHCRYSLNVHQIVWYGAIIILCFMNSVLQAKYYNYIKTVLTFTTFVKCSINIIIIILLRK